MPTETLAVLEMFRPSLTERETSLGCVEGSRSALAKWRVSR